MSAGTGYRPYPPTRWGTGFKMRCYRTDHQSAIATGSRRRRGEDDVADTTVSLAQLVLQTIRDWTEQPRPTGASFQLAETGKFRRLFGDSRVPAIWCEPVRISKPAAITAPACHKHFCRRQSPISATGAFRSGGWFWHHERPTRHHHRRTRQAGANPSPLAFPPWTSGSISTSSAKTGSGKTTLLRNMIVQHISPGTWRWLD